MNRAFDRYASGVSRRRPEMVQEAYRFFYTWGNMRVFERCDVCNTEIFEGVICNYKYPLDGGDAAIRLDVDGNYFDNCGRCDNCGRELCEDCGQFVGGLCKECRKEMEGL